jgi:predicted unusual protein kinase regulating ubiquinone biosynthesis (AarF/ABC1/UbiB family)
MRFISFKTSRLLALRRLLLWFGLILHFLRHTLADSFRGQDTVDRRALRLRHAFERGGGSFVKLGKHLSMRVDFMPWAYSVELSRMLDRVEPFPAEEAITTVERCTGKPLAATFASFDPEPIASTAVACVYQAVLLNGEKVIVKVRRPGVGELFMADIQAFDWLLLLAEYMTILRPGFTQGMRREFRDMLLEELDFVQEARRQDAFRRAAAESRKKFFSAPKVYLGLSGPEIVVEEFVGGLWLWELMAAVEQNNSNVLAQAREINIEPTTVAQRLLWVNYWAWEENLFFHADPLPDNIIIGPNSKLYFTNFGTVGTLDKTKRQALQQNMHYARLRDPLNMARATLILLEPLPPIDLIEFTQELESYNWQLLYSLEAAPESLSWQERTSAVQWAGMIRLARKYGVVVDVHVLRLVRTTLLYETMAVRLCHNIDIIEQYRRFNRYRAEQARRRVADAIQEQFNEDSNERLILRLDRLGGTIEGLFYRTRHQLSIPSVNFNAMMSKWAFAVYMLVLFLTQVMAVTGAAFLVGLVVLFLSGEQGIEASQILRTVAGSRIYQLVLLALIFANGRTVLFRMDDKEVKD